MAAEGLGAPMSMAYSQREQLRAAWEQFLQGFDFNCYFTVTFQVPSAQAQAALTRASRFLGQSFAALGIKLEAFLIAEPHVSGTYHAHGLLRLAVQDEASGAEMLAALERRARVECGLSRFEWVGDAERVRHYLSKYLVDRDADFRFVGIKGKQQKIAS